MENLLALPPGTELAGDYRIKQVLGAGGFGITYLAEEVPLNRQVAIKEYFPSDFAVRGASLSVRSKSEAAEEDYRWGLDRFIEEAQTLAKFHHPNIARVYRYFRERNTGYMVLHLEEGLSFKGWLDKLGRPPKQEELDALLAPLLDALELIHAQDFLHRDIAPDNIIIRGNGAPVLIDFGSARGDVARHSKTVSALVKPGYSPFEQYAQTGKQQGPWTDIYALAATLYHAVTGARPTDAPTRMTTDELALAANAARARYRSTFLAAIDRALRLKVEERPASIAIWRGELLGNAEPPAAPKARPAPSPPADLGKTRKIEDFSARVLKLPVFKRKKPEAQVTPPRAPKPAPVALGATALAPDPTGKPSKSIRNRLRKKVAAPANDTEPGPRPDVKPGRRRLMSLLSGIKAAAVQDVPSTPGKALVPAPVSVPAPESPTTAPKKLGKPLAKAGPALRKVLPRPRIARPVSRAVRRFVRGALVKLAIITALVTAMVSAQDWLGYLGVQPRPKTAIVTTDLSLARTLRGHEGLILGLALTAGPSPMIASLGAEGSVKLWDASTGALLKTLTIPGSPVEALAASSDRIAVARLDGSVEQWAIATGERMASSRLHDGPVLTVTFGGGNDRTLSGGQDQRIRFSSAGRRGRGSLAGHEGAVTALAFNEDKQLLISGGADRSVKLWDVRRQRLIHSYEGHGDAVRAVAIARSGLVIASGGYDKRINLWSVQTGDLLRTLEGHTGRVTALAFSPDGRRIASASEDGTARLWDAQTGRLITTYVGHSAAVRAVVFLPDGRSIATAGDDATIRIWGAQSAGSS